MLLQAATQPFAVARVARRGRLGVADGTDPCTRQADNLVWAYEVVAIDEGQFMPGASL
jgi:hypothetical protein